MRAIDREYIAWLGKIERRVVLPLKWSLLVLCSAYWVWSRGGAPPSTAAFALFVIFLGLTAAEHYFFARDRITPRQVRPFVLVSYVADGLFVAGLVLVDAWDRGPGGAISPVSDFHLLFILATLRGFALFRTRMQNLTGFLFVSALFLGTASWQVARVPMLEFLPAVQQLVLLWVVMLVTQGFIGLAAGEKEEEVARRERSVRSASLASLGELTAGVAHEINNPIGIIKTYADYLEQSVLMDDPMREDFQAIRNEAERCQKIVRRMLDFSNPEIRDMTSVDMRELAEDTATLVFRDEGGSGIRLRLDLADNAPAVRGDPVQLKQALMNILLNARQVMEDWRGHGAPEDFEPQVEVAVRRGAGPRAPVRIEVRDNGPGIAPGDVERAFEPFYTKRKEGTGLGLAITRRIVEAHDGTIRIQPIREGGTLVAIELPMEGEEDA